jgi:HAD superfamily hydrolase (TIGR01509 family)
MRQPSLLIFDCDGVLIDSQAIQCHVDAAELTRYGYPISPEALGRRFFGVATKQMQAEIERELGRTLPANFEARRNDLVEAAYRQKLKEISGVRESLEKIDLPVCVASNAATNRIQQVLGLTGLLSLFEPHLFGADLVPRPKPFPDLFLLAAERMGVPPFRRLVIEDSVTGIQAAIRAGMSVLGFHGGSHCFPGYERHLLEAGATAVFGDMRELPLKLDTVAR